MLPPPPEIFPRPHLTTCERSPDGEFGTDFRLYLSLSHFEHTAYDVTVVPTETPADAPVVVDYIVVVTERVSHVSGNGRTNDLRRIGSTCERETPAR